MRTLIRKRDIPLEQYSIEIVRGILLHKSIHRYTFCKIPSHRPRQIQFYVSSKVNTINAILVGKSWYTILFYDGTLRSSPNKRDNDEEHIRVD